MYMSPLGERAVGAERAAHATAGWWIPLVAGLLTIVVGIVVLRVHWTVSGLATFLGIVFICRGIGDALSPPLDGGARGLKVAAGLLGTGVGVALIAWPGPGLTVIATFFGCWLVVTGMTAFVGAMANRDQPSWWLLLLLGILMVILGIWALDRPATTLKLLIALSGIWAIVVGTVEIVFAFELRKLHREAMSEAHAIDTGATTSGSPVMARD